MLRLPKYLPLIVHTIAKLNKSKIELVIVINEKGWDYLYIWVKETFQNKYKDYFNMQYIHVYGGKELN